MCCFQHLRAHTNHTNSAPSLKNARLMPPFTGGSSDTFVYLTNVIPPELRVAAPSSPSSDLQSNQPPQKLAKSLLRTFCCT
jgi:hypothetical protein